MRLGLVALLLLCACRTTTTYALRLPPDADEQCISNCKAAKAIRNEVDDYLVCMSSCGGRATKDAKCADRPRANGLCFDEEATAFSFGRTFLLIALIVTGAVAVAAIDAGATARH